VCVIVNLTNKGIVRDLEKGPLGKHCRSTELGSAVRNGSRRGGGGQPSFSSEGLETVPLARTRLVLASYHKVTLLLPDSSVDFGFVLDRVCRSFLVLPFLLTPRALACFPKGVFFFVYLLFYSLNWLFVIFLIPPISIYPFAGWPDTLLSPKPTRCLHLDIVPLLPFSVPLRMHCPLARG
jgi:hypothetical protein